MEGVSIILIIASILLVLIGLVGAVVPGIAGTPISFLGLLALSFVDGIDYSTRFLVIMGVIGAIVFTLDYVVPVWGTKKFGGTKAGVRGSTIGLILGLLITIVFPVGFIVVLLGPFIGAYIGEKQRHARQTGLALSLRLVCRFLGWHFRQNRLWLRVYLLCGEGFGGADLNLVFFLS